MVKSNSRRQSLLAETGEEPANVASVAARGAKHLLADRDRHRLHKLDARKFLEIVSRITPHPYTKRDIPPVRELQETRCRPTAGSRDDEDMMSTTAASSPAQNSPLITICYFKLASLNKLSNSFLDIILIIGNFLGITGTPRVQTRVHIHYQM